MNTRLPHGLLTILCLIAVCLLMLGAAGTASPVLADTQGAWSDADQDGLDDGWEGTLAERFAPLVYFHHHEEHFPSYINWYLERTWIGYGPSLYDKTHQVDPVGNVNTLISQSHPTGDSGVTTYSGAVNQRAAGWEDMTTTDYFLEVKDESTYFGDKSSGVFGRWPVYVHVLRSPETFENSLSHPGMIDLQYWFFYPYNGALGWSCEDTCNPGVDICCPCLAGGSHEGDWEYVIVRVQADGETVHSVYYSRHSGEGRWEVPGGYAVRSDDPNLLGPVVYSAHHSHANFTHEGKHTEGKGTPDFTNDGFEWNTNLNIINIGELWHPMPGMEWIQYTGRWGELHFDVATDPHGPYGPATKSPWVGNAESNPNNLPDLTIHTGPAATAPAGQAVTGNIANTFNLGSFTDDSSFTSWTVTVNWGDGNSSTFNTSSQSLTYGHKYQYINRLSEPHVETYQVEVSVSNGFTATTTPAAFNVTVTYPGDTEQHGPDYSVNSRAPDNDGKCGWSNCTLAEAIQAANNDGLNSKIDVPCFITPYRVPESTISSPITIDGGACATLQSATYDPRYDKGNRMFNVSAGGDLTIKRVTLKNAKGEVGGAILNQGKLTISECTLSDNEAGSGGAIYNVGTLIISRSTLSSNGANNTGGALHNQGTATIVNSTLWGNTAGYEQQTGQYYPGEGGAIYNYGTLTILSSTLANNQAGSSSTCNQTSPGAGSANICNMGTATVKNTILASAPFEYKYCRTTTQCTTTNYPNGSCSGSALVANSILYTDTSCGTAPVTDAKLSTLGNNGSFTQTVSLLPGSPAIDRGNTTACQDPLLFTTPEITNLWSDQRSYKRFIDGTDTDTIAQCDIGAFEYGSVPGSNAPADDENPPMAWIELIPATPDGANGWYKSPVTLTPNAFDDVDVIDLRCALDPAVPPASYAELPEAYCDFLDPETATVNTDGPHTLYAAALDEAGNPSEIVSASFQIDTTPPVLTCPAAGPFLLNSGDQPVGPAGVDASVSGLDEAASTLSGIVPTGSVGLKGLTFTAFDLAGNSASQVCNYHVIYDFGGFYPPVAAAPVLNPAVSGSAIPLKFSLAGDQGLDILAAGFPTMQQVSCDTLEPIGAPSVTKPAGKSGLSYDPETGWYNYVWKTGKAKVGSCQAVILQLIDGTQHIAYFKFQ